MGSNSIIPPRRRPCGARSSLRRRHGRRHREGGQVNISKYLTQNISLKISHSKYLTRNISLAGSSRRQLTAGDAAADQAQQQPPHLVVAKQAHPESLHPSPSSPSAQERTGGMDIGSVKITQLGLEVDSALRQRARAEARNRQARGARAAALQRNGRNGRSKRPATAAAHPARY
eukprot:SAG31_NODE_75_length_27561_cov_28.859333_12_plen_174_part_00